LHTAEANTKHIDADVLTDKVSYNTTSYALDGHQIDKKELVAKLVPPVAAVVLFYILMAVLGNRLSVSMTEEKENRISELLLVSIKPINLIIGKIISLMNLGLIQLVVLLIPVIIVYLLALRNNLIPEEYMISLNAQSIILHALLLIASYFLFTAINVLVGTLVSTAKEASSFAGVIVIVMIIPFMMLNVFTTGETSTLLYILSYFPLSAPLTLMIRSIFDTLPQWELLLGIADIFVFAGLLAILAAKIFCHNAVNFSIGLNLSNFGKKRKSW
jgi:ABC-2 type transport system permease protein